MNSILRNIYRYWHLQVLRNIRLIIIQTKITFLKQFMKKKRNRTIGSVKSELLTKAREAALSAIQIFNSPLLLFKSETFIVLMVIAWTYLLHAYYRSKEIEYRYYEQKNKRRSFERIENKRTKHKSFKYWELSKCLKCSESPIDRDTTNKLRISDWYT